MESQDIFSCENLEKLLREISYVLEPKKHYNEIEIVEDKPYLKLRTEGRQHYADLNCMKHDVIYNSLEIDDHGILMASSNVRYKVENDKMVIYIKTDKSPMPNRISYELKSEFKGPSLDELIQISEALQQIQSDISKNLENFADKKEFLAQKHSNIFITDKENKLVLKELTKNIDKLESLKIMANNLDKEISDELNKQ